MKINKGLIAYLLVTIVINVNAMERQIRRSAERILGKDRISNTAKQQKKLIESFSEQDLKSATIFSDDFSLVISALTAENTFPTLSKYEQLLHQANEQFHDIAGFKELFKRIVRASPHADDAHLRGALYELELALQICQEEDSTEEILEFEKKIVDPSNGKTKRIIDIVTTLRWIECKDRSPLARNLKDLKGQIKSQKTLADQYNKEHSHSPITYQVHFRSPINEQLIAWFTRQKITFVAPN